MKSSDMDISLVILLLVFSLFMFFLKVFMIGSVVTSAIKALSNSCGKEYWVEFIVNGNWFCS